VTTNWSIKSKILTAFILTSFVVYVWTFAEVHHRKIRADHLLLDLQRLQIGLTSADEIKRLSEKYDGKFAESSSSYQLRIVAPNVMIRNEPYALPGLRLWAMLAVLGVRENRLDRIDLMTGISRSGKTSIGALVTVSAQQNPQGNTPYSVRYVTEFSSWPSEFLSVRATPDASSIQLQKAFDVKLSCFTSFLPCQNVCDIMRRAWDDLPSGGLSGDSADAKKINAECKVEKVTKQVH